MQKYQGYAGHTGTICHQAGELKGFAIDLLSAKAYRQFSQRYEALRRLSELVLYFLLSSTKSDFEYC